MGSSAVGGGGGIPVPIVSLAMGAQGFRDDVPGSMVGISEGMREGGSSSEGEGSGGEGSGGEGSNEVRIGLQTRGPGAGVAAAKGAMK